MDAQSHKLQQDLEDAKRLGFCPYCMHDLWYEDWCHECNSDVPQTLNEFTIGLTEWNDVH